MKYWALTEEQKEQRREAARDWKERNKGRRVDGKYIGDPEPGYVQKSAPKQRYNQNKREQMQSDAWWEALKKKHAGKPRLKKSIKPPIILGPDKGVGR